MRGSARSSGGLGTKLLCCRRLLTNAVRGRHCGRTSLQLFAWRKALVRDEFPAVRDTQAGELPAVAARILSDADRILTIPRPSLSARRRLRLHHAILPDAAGVHESAISTFRAHIEGPLRTFATAAVSGKQRRHAEQNEQGAGTLWHSMHRISDAPA
jgi:hypothetical protein